MTSLNKPTLGTDPIKGWALYPIHLATSYVNDEYFLATRYKSSIANAEHHEKELEHKIAVYENIFEKFPYKVSALNQAHDLSTWALKMKEENYHEIFTHAFVGMWAAFETGIENTTATIIQFDKVSAIECVKKFKIGRYPIEDWPWTPEICMEIAQKLDTKAKNLTENGGVNIFERIKTIFSWMSLEVIAEDETIKNLAEANKIRNTILHRYGVISNNDATDIPKLKSFVGNVMPIKEDIFFIYYNAIHVTLTSIARAIYNSKRLNKEISS